MSQGPDVPPLRDWEQTKDKVSEAADDAREDVEETAEETLDGGPATT